MFTSILVRRLLLLASATFAIMTPCSVAATRAANNPEPAVSRLASAELAYLRERMDRDGDDCQLDLRVGDALGLSSPEGPPLTLRYLGLVNPSHGDYYFLAPLSDGRFLLGRDEFTGRIGYWLVVSPDFSLENAILAVAEGTAPLRPEQAEAERRRILAFFRSNVPALRSGSPVR